MNRSFRAEQRMVIGVSAAVLAATLLGGCIVAVVAGVRQPSKPTTSTYTVVVRQSLRAASAPTGTVTDAAIKAATPSAPVLTFRVADTENGTTRTIRVLSVTGTGDPTQLAAAHGLVDLNLVVGGTPTAPAMVTALPVAQANEVAILEDTLARLPAGPTVGTKVTDNAATGPATFKGRPAESTEGGVNAKVAAAPTVAYSQATPEAGYSIDPDFEQAFGGPRTVPSDTVVGERSPNAIDQIAGVFVCLFTFFFRCPNEGPSYTTVPVAGPQADVQWIGSAPATATQVDLRQDHLLLTANASGTIDNVGTILAQANLPTQISAIGVRQRTDWTATASIASKLPSTTGESTVILCLGAAMLLLSGASGAVAVRQLTAEQNS